MTDLNIIVPVHNEEKSIGEFAQRLITSLGKKEINYRIIFVNDHSTDNSVDEIKRTVKSNFPKEVFQKSRRRTKHGNVRFQESTHATIVWKVGPRGKATSILLGGDFSDAEFLAVIDSDLSYPPEAVFPMYELAKEKGMAVSRRVSLKTDLINRIKIGFHRFFIDSFLLKIKHDSQSSIKVFRTDILQHLDLNHVGKWSIDIPLIKTALDLGLEVDSYDIEYQKRKHTRPTVSITQKSAEIPWNALKLRLAGHRIYQIRSTQKGSMVGAGIIHKGAKYITHTHLPVANSAIRVLEYQQSLTLIAVIGIVVLGLILNAKTTAITIMAVLSAIYFADILFSLYTLLKSLHFPPEVDIPDEKIKALKDSELPVYSIMAPLYKEANVLPHFLESIDKIDWPKDKLDVMLLLEENDHETIEAAKNIGLPSYVRVLIVPHSQPKTKPKACNYGLNFAKGEYVVIYDAEDKPDPLQLKKAFLGFRNLGYKYACVQSKLNYYNTDQNLLTRLFTAEYSLWFDLVLPGLQSIDTAIPLGGTSNHFRTAELRRINGWDPFNVTEDCDLGARLFKLGKKTAIINSVTYEEANSKIHNWLRQRSRWLKGYFQTYFVHMRNPIAFIRDFGIHAFIFQLIIGLRISFILINPILWAMTIAYFTAYQYVGPQIESLFPPAVFYIAVSSAVFGNFMYLYNYMIGAAKHGKWSVIKFVFLVPFYWLMTSWAAVIAFYQLIVKPYYWEKTIHGLNLKPQTSEEAIKNLSFRLKFMNLPLLKNVGKLKSKTVLAASSLIAAVIFANFMNFVYSLYLGRHLSVEEFGLIALIGNLLYLVQIPSTAISRTITHKSAFFYGMTESAVREIWEYFRPRILKISLVLAFLWIVATPFLTVFFNSHSILPFLLFTPLWILVITGAVDGGFIEGNLKFQYLAFLSVIESVTKFAAAYIFVALGLSNLIYLSPVVSLAIIYVIAYVLINKNIRRSEVHLPDEAITHFPIRFFLTSILRGLSTAAFLSFDLILAKHFLSATDAGYYALLSLIGKMIYFTGTIFSQFTLSIVSREEGAGRKSKAVFYKVLSAITVSVLIAFMIVGVFGKYTLPILLGDKILAVIPHIVNYTFAMVLFTVAQSIVTFHQIKKRWLFPMAGFLMAVLQVVGLYMYHSGLGDVVKVMLFVGIAYFGTIVVMHITYEYIIILFSNLSDLAGLFKKAPAKTKVAKDKLRILILNWRDTKHYWAGGAEVYVHELAKRWVQAGHNVTVFCGNDSKNPRNETIDGVQIVRRGGFYTVYMWAFLYYVFKFKKCFDVVIDSENGIPFFTPLYVEVPVIGLIHHVHSEIILKELKLPKYLWPVGMVAKILETQIMPSIYENSQMVTVSRSTKKDMEKIGFGKKLPIKIINPGVDISKLRPGTKTKNPSILYLGRLKAYKSVDTLIRATSLIIKEVPNVKLNIAGFGDARNSLEKLVDTLNIKDKVNFLGRVSDKEKIDLMASSWVFAYPSRMEGWGISIIEANACGTPVVASNVPGLRDSVRNPSTGYLVKYKDVHSFANKITVLLKNDNIRRAFGRQAVKWAALHTWDASANKFLKVLITSC